MRILLFDTETTGLPKSREPATAGPNNWPHLVSIAWIIIENEQIVKKEYYLIKPQWVIPEDASKIHGITQEKAEAEGFPLSDIITKFLSEQHDILIAHNLSFDLNVLVNAVLWDLGKPYPNFGKTFCTMEASRIICKMPFGNGRSGYKSPKLSELHQFITRRPTDTTSLHNALYDTTLLADIVLKSTVLRSMIGLPVVPNKLTNDYSIIGTTLRL